MWTLLNTRIYWLCVGMSWRAGQVTLKDCKKRRGQNKPKHHKKGPTRGHQTNWARSLMEVRKEGYITETHERHS